MSKSDLRKFVEELLVEFLKESEGGAFSDSDCRDDWELDEVRAFLNNYSEVWKKVKKGGLL